MAEAIPPGKRVTLGRDRNYDTEEFVRELRRMNITPHVAQNNTRRRSAVDERTTRHAGYEVSQRKRKRVEQSFGWMKMVESEAARDRQCGVAVYLHWACLQPLPTAKPDGQSMKRSSDSVLWVNRTTQSTPSQRQRQSKIQNRKRKSLDSSTSC